MSVDTGCKVNGWCGDSAWTYPVGNIDDATQRLLDVTEGSLNLAIENLDKCRFWSEVAHKVQAYVEQAGFSVVKEFVGHGIGTQLHEEPQIKNYGDPGYGPRLKEGMVLAIEPMVNTGSYGVRLLDDGWTAVTRDGGLSAHFEHSVAVTVNGPEILSSRIGGESAASLLQATQVSVAGS